MVKGALRLFSVNYLDSPTVFRGIKMGRRADLLKVPASPWDDQTLKGT